MRRLRGRARRPSGGPTLPLTSLMDVLTNVLVFLLVVGEPAASPDDVALPPSTADLLPPPHEVEVDVTTTTIRVDGEPVVELVRDPATGEPAIPSAARAGRALPALAAGLAAHGRGAGEGRIVLRCDRGVPFAVVRDVLATADDAGFGAFRFAVDRAGP